MADFLKAIEDHFCGAAILVIALLWLGENLLPIVIVKHEYKDKKEDEDNG